MLFDVVNHVLEDGLKPLDKGWTNVGVWTSQLVSSSFTGKDFVVMAKGVDSLKQWTVKARAKIIYDSVVDPFTHDGLFVKVKGKPNVAVVGFTTDGDVFGGFFSISVTKQGTQFFDPTIFAFSFESHGRCATPQRFVVKEGLKEKAFVYFWKTCNSGFVQFGVFGNGCFLMGNQDSDSLCWDLSLGFEGLGDTTLSGSNNTNPQAPPYHHCTRLVAVQLS